MAYDWPDSRDYKKEAELFSKRIYSVSVPTGLMQSLVKMVALHDGWKITDMVLSPGYDDEAYDIKEILEKSERNRGYYIELFESLKKLDYSLAVLWLTITDQDGNYLHVYQDGVVIGVNDPSEILNAVIKTAQKY